jgi:hypothetical protein
LEVEPLSEWLDCCGRQIALAGIFQHLRDTVSMLPATYRQAKSYSQTETNLFSDAHLSTLQDLSRPTGKRLAVPGWSNIVKKLFRRGMIPGLFLNLSRLERLLALQIGKHQLA